MPYPTSMFLPCRPRLRTALLLISLAGTIPAAHGGVMFTGCVTGSDGSITCNTVPTGNTYLNDQAARYGLLQNASPGWSEFSPYQGYNQELGGGFD
ncbi:MAG: hypothetical protein WCF98_03945 [Synechococcus sp. ELA057]|jgi:hypothetical protein